MNRIEGSLADTRERGQGALIPYVCAGSPSVDTLPRLLPVLERSGASVIEVGIPYSDPIADGPVIAASMHAALERGMTPGLALEQIASVRERVEAGIVAMVSVSLVHAAGFGAFVERCRDAGVDGFIFPDAPLEESDELIAAAGEAGLTASLLIAPTTPPDRAARIAEACTGFVYLIARAGITGERDAPPEIAERVRELRGVTRLPIACGFGISTPEHVRAVCEHADAAIVGSALVRRLDAEAVDPVSEAESFVTELSTGLVRL